MNTPLFKLLFTYLGVGDALFLLRVVNGLAGGGLLVIIGFFVALSLFGDLLSIRRTDYGHLEAGLHD